MKYKMTSIKDHKTTTTALVTIFTLAGILVLVLVAGTSVIGSGHSALADIRINNTGINVPTDTDQKSECKTTGQNSPITNSCNAASTNIITESGGIITHGEGHK